MRFQRAWAEIDLAALGRNVAALRRLRPDRGILAVVKADAYGHAALPVARALLAAGVQGLCVGDAREALELRQAGLAGPILILGTVVGGELPAVVANDITVAVHAVEDVSRLAAEARRRGRPAFAHMKIDTGLGRLGVLPAEAGSVVAAAAGTTGICLEGCFTHFAGTGAGDLAGAREQARRFRATLDRLAAESGFRPRRIHARNSAWALSEDLDDGGADCIRPGAFLYGFSPGAGVELPGFTPVLSLRSKIVHVKSLPGGAGVGYGGTYRTGGPTRIGILPLGYDDGYPRAAANRAAVLVRGRRAPVVGAVSMDYTTIDLTSIPEASPGDTATLVGEDGGDRIRLEDLALAAETVPHAVACGVGRRVARLVIGGREDPVAGAAVEERA